MLQKSLYTLLIVSSFLMLAACEPEKSSDQAGEVTMIGGVVETDDTRFAAAGIENGQDVADFLATLKQAVADDDREKVSSLINYPMTIYDGGEVLAKYTDAAAVVENYDLLFNDQVKTEIAKATADSLFANDEGVMIGQGQIWFNLFDGELKIMTVQSIN